MNDIFVRKLFQSIATQDPPIIFMCRSVLGESSFFHIISFVELYSSGMGSSLRKRHLITHCINMLLCISAIRDRSVQQFWSVVKLLWDCLMSNLTSALNAEFFDIDSGVSSSHGLYTFDAVPGGKPWCLHVSPKTLESACSTNRVFNATARIFFEYGIDAQRFYCWMESSLVCFSWLIIFCVIHGSRQVKKEESDGHATSEKPNSPRPKSAGLKRKRKNRNRNNQG